MGLLEEIEESKKKLAELTGEDSAPEEKEDEAKDDAVEEVDDSKTDEGKNEADPKDAKDEKSAEEKKTEADPDKKREESHAKLRRDAAAAKKKAEDLEKEIAEIKKSLEVKAAPAVVEDDKEPDVKTDPAAWLKWSKRQTDKQIEEIRQWKEEKSTQDGKKDLYERAIAGFQAYENEFRAGVDDYDDRAMHFSQTMAQSIAALNPRMSGPEIAAAVKNQVLKLAAEFAADGLNPAEELYHLAQERYGYKPKEAEQEESEEEKKPDQRKLAENRKRNAGTAGARGRGGGGQLTPLAATDMTSAEWAKLPKAEKDKIFAQLAGQG